MGFLHPPHPTPFLYIIILSHIIRSQNKFLSKQRLTGHTKKEKCLSMRKCFFFLFSLRNQTPIFHSNTKSVLQNLNSSIISQATDTELSKFARYLLKLMKISIHFLRALKIIFPVTWKMDLQLVVLFHIPAFTGDLWRYCGLSPFLGVLESSYDQ